MHKGLYISGKESLEQRAGAPAGVANDGVPPAWTGTDGRVNIPVDVADPGEQAKLEDGLRQQLGNLTNPVVLGYRA